MLNILENINIQSQVTKFRTLSMICLHFESGDFLDSNEIENELLGRTEMFLTKILSFDKDELV